MNLKIVRFSTLLGLVLALGACTSIPTGPDVLVLPGTGKNFDQFRMDDMDCRQYASNQIGGGSAASSAADSGVKSAVVGTAIGAAAGALMGGHEGAAAGAGAGLIFGSVAGSSAGEYSGYSLQQRYDHAYQQCMYVKGHRVPVPGGFDYSRQTTVKGTKVFSSTASKPPQPSAAGATIPPPPPSGTPPPPPPDYYHLSPSSGEFSAP